MSTPNELFLSQPGLIILGQGERISKESPNEGFTISGLCSDLDTNRGIGIEVPSIASIYRGAQLVHDSGLIRLVYPRLAATSIQPGRRSLRYDLDDKGRTALFAHSLALEIMEVDLSQVFVIPEIVDAVIALNRTRESDL